MPSLVIVRAAAHVAMGAQVYETAVIGRTPDVLAPGWEFREEIVRSLRSSLPGTVRLPLGRLASAPTALRQVIGHGLYPRDAIVHRMSLVLPPARRGRDIVTLHDLIAWKYPDEAAPIPAARTELRRSAAVVCGSRYIAQQIVDFFGVSDPEVIPYGVDERFFDAPPLSPTDLASLGVTGRYVLASGGASERKNLQALAAAWPRIATAYPDVSLVLSGPEHPRRTDLFKRLPRVHLVGRVPDALVPGLMASAVAVVVPSLDEGFGLPALEAMAVGTTVVAADTSSLTEVVGDGGYLVAPTADGVAEGLALVLSQDPEVDAVTRRGAVRARQFTWSRCVEGHARVWHRVAAGR